METVKRGRPTEHKDPAYLPNKVRPLRLARGLSLNQLASMIDVEPQSLSEFELEGTGLGRQKIYRLSDVLDTDPRELETPGIFFQKKVR